MMDIKIIRTEAEYEQALARVETLMDAAPGSPQEDELELLALLVENYEQEHYPIDLPDPIEAIKFRMEQEGLEPKDMVKYLGSQSKVSEVLNHKRPLSLTMIRNLKEGLDIPAEVLLQRTNGESEPNPNWLQAYPFTEMFKRNYFENFEGTLPEAKRKADELLNELLSVFELKQFHRIYCKQADREIDISALSTWQAKCMQIASKGKLPPFSRRDLSENFIHQVVKLSYFEDGPRLAKELMNKKGIHIITLSHLPKTYLDGACFYGLDQQPVIAMTLRYNRLDNFWFTLIHELAHLYLHLDESNLAFFDDTEQLLGDPEHSQEREANDLTMEMLIPTQIWNENERKLLLFQDPETLKNLANRLEISPAIIAGRVHWETKDYSIFPDLIGSNEVRRHFPEFV
jgi:HTH-type transcriptional regulator / antitoxin HigA